VISAFPTPNRYWSPRKLSNWNPLPPSSNSRDHLELKLSKEEFPKATYKEAIKISADAATIKLRACFNREVVLVLNAAWFVKGPAFTFCDVSIAAALKICLRRNRCPQ
jgi:hypothetical protein